ncbi:conserved hypothetical protein [Latilactobacillus fuchuensis]|uniref:MazG-like protein n=2 Tax=Latilactobacillus fuchuensis TaxID=164393 RepID=A0A2N9DUF3_9LACO|nr:conserved hypothetical protein [Latilactobacillus fuchuensis]
MDMTELETRSKQIRTAYHQLEMQQDGRPWTTEQDALAFMSDAGIVSRLIMDQVGSWPQSQSEFTLDYKIAESIWWLLSIADSTNIDIEKALENFLVSREKHLN